MAYYMFMDTMQIPIPPESLTTTINNKNNTLDLLGVGEVNVLQSPGLTDISFKMLLPNSDYPFNESLIFKGRKASYYIDKLEELKNGSNTTGISAVDSVLDKRKFQFIVVRMKPNGEMLQMTNMKVTLEDYRIVEEASEGFDCYAEITLKQWRDYGTKKVTLETDKDGNVAGTAEQKRPVDGKVANSTAKASTGCTLQRIVKKELGNTNNLFKIAALNKIAVPGVLAVGQVLQMHKKGEF